MMGELIDDRHPCPACGKVEFPCDNSFVGCPYCGWQDDGVQEDDPDYAGGANKMSLNQHKAYIEQLKKEGVSFPRWPDSFARYPHDFKDYQDFWDRY